MLNENARAWVAALRSGEYAQGTGHLKSVYSDGSATYCCLGVAAELFRQAHPEEARWEDGAEATFASAYGKNEFRLTIDVRSWLGLNDGSGRYGRKISNTSLANANDREGFTFAQIADLIESEPDGLFFSH